MEIVKLDKFTALFNLWLNRRYIYTQAKRTVQHSAQNWSFDPRPFILEFVTITEWDGSQL